jgi:hypothetical protein
MGNLLIFASPYIRHASVPLRKIGELFGEGIYPADFAPPGRGNFFDPWTTKNIFAIQI